MDPTAFQNFGVVVGVNTFDLPSRAIEFTPLSFGGLSGWAVTGNGGVVDMNPAFAAVESFGGGCDEARSFVYSPDGVGGYSVTAGPSAFDPNLGSFAGATADDTITATNIDLGFPMLFPDGNTYQFVDIDPNGRLIPSSFNAAGDFSPSVIDITTSGYPMIFGLWADFNVNSITTTGGIMFQRVPGVSATFTWDRVAQFGNGTVPVTFQVKLLNGGSYIVTLQDVTGLNVSGDDDIAMGNSSGALPNPGEIDHTAVPVVTTSYAYEWWDAAFAPVPEPFPFAQPSSSLVANTLPLQGATWDVQAVGVDPAATIGFYLISTSTTGGVDLSPFGSPCMQEVPLDLVVVAFPDGLGSLDPLLVPIPAMPSFAGLELHVQCATDEGGVGFGPFLGTLPWELKFTNAIRGTVGDQ